jgi:hypothetical protein
MASKSVKLTISHSSKSAFRSEIHAMNAKQKHENVQIPIYLFLSFSNFTQKNKSFGGIGDNEQLGRSINDS